MTRTNASHRIDGSAARAAAVALAGHPRATSPSQASPPAPARTRQNPPGSSTRPRGAIHKLLLAFVWLTVASGALVFSEPAPVDVLTILLVVLLPVAGLFRLTPSLLYFLAAWLVVAAGAFVAATLSSKTGVSVIHSSISLYLYFGAIVFAGFIARNPAAHMRLVLNAYLFSAVAASLAGIIGYFDIIPGAHDYLTRFGRASGTFKDPNVYGPFLIPALLYAIHLITSRDVLRTIFPMIFAAIIALAVVLSFSRGAWLALAISVLAWGYLSFVTAPSHLHRFRLIAMAVLGLTMATLALSAVVQMDSVADLFAERASLDHSYDYGPDGRFGGHDKAVDLILDHPLGLGAGVFARDIHREDVHNVYLAMFLNAGWLGGFSYIAIIGLTLVLGLRHCFRCSQSQPLFLVIFAAFVGNAVEGHFVDTDHWRHFYLLLGLIWGHMAGATAGTIEAPPMARDLLRAPPSLPPRRPTLRRKARRGPTTTYRRPGRQLKRSRQEQRRYRSRRRHRNIHIRSRRGHCIRPMHKL